MSIRWKLLLIALITISSVGVVAGVVLKREFDARVSTGIEQELHRQALLVREALRPALAEARPEGVNARVARLSKTLGDRITIIAPDGRIVADADPSGAIPVDSAPSRSLDIRDRPEIVAALRLSAAQSVDLDDAPIGGYGSARDDRSLHLAVPFPHPQGLGVVRVSRSLAELGQVASRLHTLLLLAGLLGLAVAILMSVIGARVTSRNLRHMTERVRALSRASDDGPTERLNIVREDDVGQLAGSINRMADHLQTTVATLASERARFAAALRDLPNAVIRLDKERHIRVMNAAAVGLLDLPQAPIGAPFIQYLRAPAVHELLDHLDGQDERGSAEFWLSSGTERRLVMVHASAQPGDAGYILVLHDITDMRKLETVRQDFVANVSHELRTPVSIIRANAETLIDGAMADPVHGERLLSAVHRNAERLSTIIAELLDLSRLEAGRFHTELDEASVLTMTERAIDAVERAAQSKRIELSCEITEADDVTLHTDLRICERILINYLDNAIKYTPPEGRIRVRAERIDRRVRLEVIDNGPGISEPHRKRVFERFYRIDPGRSRSMGGTGLGLSIVKHASELLGGEVGVAPVEPHGSCFWVTLPLSRPPSAPPVTAV